MPTRSRAIRRRTTRAITRYRARRRSTRPIRAPRANRVRFAGGRPYNFTRVIPVPGIYFSAGSYSSQLTRGYYVSPLNAVAFFKSAVALQEITNYAEISALFDEIKVHRITLYFDYLYNVSQMGSGQGLPEIQWVQDKDFYAPASYPDITQFQGVKRFAFADKARRRWSASYRPVLFETVADATGAFSVVKRPNSWVQTSASTMQFPGMTGMIFNWDSDATQAFVVGAKISFSCRNMH